MRSFWIVLLAACRAREAPPPPPQAAPAPPPSHAPGDPAADWTGAPLEVRSVQSAPVHFVLGDDVTAALATPHGWLGTRSRKGEIYLEDLVDEHGVIATVRLPRLVAADATVYAMFESAEGPPHVSRLAGKQLVPLAGEHAFYWAFAIDHHTIAVANVAPDGVATQHWQTLGIEHDKLAVIETTELGDFATGAARLGNEIILAAREHDHPSGASTEDKAAALIASEHGDHAALGAIVGQPRGWLVHVDATGHAVRREEFPHQTPSGLAVTRDGWLVIATEGTAGHGFRDGVIVGRAPKSAALELLASDIELASDTIAAGNWVCLYTMPGDTRVVHCIDPVRRIHVASEPLGDNISLLGIELAPRVRVLLHHTWYRNDYAKPPIEETLEIPLP